MTDRTHDSQNRLTEVGTLAKSHTANGELTSLSGLSAQYDAWGRTKRANNIVINVEYEYDALNRRIVRDYDDGHGGGDVRHDYHSAQWQVIEEREDGTAAGDTATQYVWSPVYVDALILRDVDQNADGDTTDTSDERLYVQHDANFNVTAIADDDGSGGGTVLERYLYDAYGLRTVLDADWTADLDGATDYSWYHSHQGGRLDAITGLHHFRNRDYDATLMRWTRQDPLGYVDGTSLRTYLGNRPIQFVDPNGLSKRIPGEWRRGWWDAAKALVGLADQEVQDAFDQSNSDIVNGYGDALGIEGLAGHNHTFDPEARKKAECFAKCMGNKAIEDFSDALGDQFAGPLAPFVQWGPDQLAKPENPFANGVDGVKDLATGVYGPTSLPRKFIRWSGFVEGMRGKDLGDVDAWTGGRFERDLYDGTKRGKFLNRLAKGAKIGGALAYATKLSMDSYNCWNKCNDDPCSFG